jgi:hypothetical protein
MPWVFAGTDPSLAHGSAKTPGTAMERKHEWGWAALVITLILGNFGFHVWHEFRSCSGPAHALKLCEGEPLARNHD